MNGRGFRTVLLASVFVVATCGLVYELIAGTVASYLLGDSVTQFSTVIGTYLFAMGVGSWLSRHVHRNELAVFIRVELLVGLVGGCSAALLYTLFPLVESFRIPLYTLVFVVGALVGLEIPLLLRILRSELEFRDLVSRVLSFDYVGALAASLLFPLVLVPHLGLMRSAFLFGLVNTGVALFTLAVLGRALPQLRGLVVTGCLVALVLAAGFAGSDRLLAWTEAGAFADPVVYAKSSPYQRIVLTRGGDDLRLHLNGNLQFSSRDEYRYHESLVHPGLARLPHAARVLVLGGGDGLAVREVLRHPLITQVTLVDLDPEITRLFSRHPLLTALNARALTDPRVRVVNADAFAWLDDCREAFDFVVIDFPDPSSFSLGKLYSTAFYRRLRHVLAPGAGFVVQCTSPFVARRSFWCIDSTLRASGYVTEPYHSYVPSFGEWGFILASPQALPREATLPGGLKFLDAATLELLYAFPPDLARVEEPPNQLNNQHLVRLFEQEWKHAVP